MNIMTKRGSQDNTVIYEHYCDTKADLANIPQDQISLGSVAIVLKDEDDSMGIYLANSNKEWISFSTGGSGGGSNMNDISLANLIDVSLANPNDGDTLVYDAANEKWVAQAGSVQSDWDESDENNPAYIKNRPFYTDEKWVELFSGDIDFGTPFNVNNVRLAYVGNSITQYMDESISQDEIYRITIGSTSYEGHPVFNYTMSGYIGAYNPGYTDLVVQNKVGISFTNITGQNQSVLTNAIIEATDDDGGIKHVKIEKYVITRVPASDWDARYDEKGYIANRPCYLDQVYSAELDFKKISSYKDKNILAATIPNVVLPWQISSDERTIIIINNKSYMTSGYGDRGLTINGNINDSSAAAGVGTDHSISVDSTTGLYNLTLTKAYLYDAEPGTYTFKFSTSSKLKKLDSFYVDSPIIDWKQRGSNFVNVPYIYSGTGFQSLVLGTNGTSSSSNAKNTASGPFSMAVGQSCTASGEDSFANGYVCTASGDYSHAEGRGCQAKSNGSHAEGYYTIANAAYQHASGRFNVSVSDSSIIEVVGCGANENYRANARTLDTSGNEMLSGSLTVKGGNLTVGSTSITESQLQQLLALLNT